MTGSLHMTVQTAVLI
ncbi:hypothetical protein AB0C77_26705, partial [Streptomyces sp. NPDC048629]